MAAVAGHSGYRGDPWGRLQRTSTFLAVTTYGTAADAQRAIDRVRAIHEHIRGTTPDGTPATAADPHLLGWVHAAETDSFLRAHERYGARPLDAASYDAYVADTARIAEARGVLAPPATATSLPNGSPPTGPNCGPPLPPEPPPASSSSSHPCPSRYVPSTADWPPTPSSSSHPGPAACCGCRAYRSWRTPPYAPPARPSPEPSAGP